MVKENARVPTLALVWVIAAIIEELFVLCGAAMVFNGGHARWGHAILRPAGILGGLSERLAVLHAPLAWGGAAATVVLVAVWGLEIKRAPSRARARAGRSEMLRSERLFETLRAAMRYGVLPILFVVATGFAVLWHGVSRGAGWMHPAADASHWMLARVHAGHFFGPLIRSLWLFSGLLLALLALLLARVRSSRLQERSVRYARVLEDVPQGAALGTAMGILFALVLAVWSGSVPANAALLVGLVAAGCTAAHCSAVVATSGGWRFLPLAFSIAVIAGDLFRGGGENHALWGVALAFGIFGLLAARVGRRYA